jgi:hypothetical protein
MIVWTIKPEHINNAISRFAEPGGFHPPPDSVKMLNRWHDVSGSRGFSVVDSDDTVSISKWCHDWSDLLTFEVIPVLDDDQLIEVIGRQHR